VVLSRETTANAAAEPASPTPTASATEAPTPDATVTPARRQARSSDLRVRITSGDTLTDLASHYYGSAGSRVLETIRDANPWLRDPDIIWIGKTLILPAPRATDDPPLRRSVPSIDAELPVRGDDPFSEPSSDDYVPPPSADDTSAP
jgi:phage tail protein X